MRTQLFYSAVCFALAALIILVVSPSWYMGAVFPATMGVAAYMAHLKKDQKPIDETQKQEIDELKKRIANLELRTGFLKQDRMR